MGRYAPGRRGSTSIAAAKKHSAPMNVPTLASKASSVTPDFVTNAPRADTPKATHPIMLIHSARQPRDFSSTTPTLVDTAAAGSPPAPSAGPKKTNCIHPAEVKNHEPAKHNRLTSPAPASADKLGSVATAKSVEPIANSQHCRDSVATSPTLTVILAEPSR